MSRVNKIAISIILSCLLLVMWTGFRSAGDKMVRKVHVEILSNEGNQFTSEEEVLNLMRGEDNVLTLPISKWDMNEMEKRIETNPFIGDAEVYRDVKGNVLVRVMQRKPIARIYHHQIKDKYISENGELLPTNAQFTARVPIVELNGLTWEDNLNESSYGKQVLELLSFIEQDEFWKAQIAHLIIHSDGEIEMIPQLSKQRVFFGMPEDIETKFEKLMLFYKKILPAKGWNAYDKVNLKIKDQIICE